VQLKAADSLGEFFLQETFLSLYFSLWFEQFRQLRPSPQWCRSVCPPESLVPIACDPFIGGCRL